MKEKTSIKGKRNTFVIKIHKCQSLTEVQTDFLSKLLFLSKYNTSFEINRSLVEICTTTKLKKTFSDDGPTEILIYYNIPASEPQLETFESDFIDIISNKQDKRYYEQVDHDIRFNIVGVRSIATLSVPQIQYMNNLVNQYKQKNLISASNSKPCKHYKTFQ
jgi:hypothetical protein